MEPRRVADLKAARKRWFSRWLRDWPPLRLALAVASRLLAPRQPVGAVGVIFDERGRVLLLEHVFRTDFPWGLPGGYVKRGEDPRQAVRRELEEELGAQVEVGALLASEPIGLVEKSTHPKHLGLAYACRFVGGECRPGREVISVEWVRPEEIRRTLSAFQAKAIALAVAAVRDRRSPETMTAEEAGPGSARPER
jgi:ADP-ribose pyrophosphatase YjhB (NUDIX family)